MKFKLQKELPLLLISILPALFLVYIWNNLPVRVPMHWDINGEVNRFGNKNELIFVGILPIFIYALFLAIPMMDPKKRLEAMGDKFYTIRLITGLFITVLFLFIIYSVKEQSLGNPNYLFMIIGAFFVLLGNYFKNIKPNYFVGIRTPWTLENETIWKTTHRFAGKLWVVGGLAVIISCFIFDHKIALNIFIVVTAIISLVPILHSYLLFRNNPQKA
jgi:uncharacterized membrane protein